MRAGIYARISQDTEGTELGVQRQQTDCRREAERRGWEISASYVDNDVSATRSRVRPEYQRMLGDIKAGRIDAVVVWAVDRLTRTPRELEDIIDLAGAHGVQFANVSGTIDLSTPEGRAMARNMGTFARLEVENMARRLKRRFQEKAEKGEPHGYSPYGYRRVVVVDPTTGREAKRDVIEEAEAAIIRDAAQRVLARESLRSIVADYNARGILSPQAAHRAKRGDVESAGSSWNSTILRQILLRPTIAGLRQHQGKIIGPSTTPAILSRDVFDQVQALLTDPTRKSNHVGPGFKYLLSGIARCGRCGGVMRRQMGRVQKAANGSSKRQPPSYNCSECFRVRRNQERVDEVVREVVIARLSQEDALALFATSDSGRAEEVTGRLQGIDAKLELVADQFADDEITADQFKRITTKLRTSRDLLDKELRSLQPSSVVADLVGGDVRAKWDALPVAAQREVVEALMVVTILPAGSGQRFDPSSVQITWH